jgi:hypothetical protein
VQLNHAARNDKAARGRLYITAITTALLLQPLEIKWVEDVSAPAQFFLSSAEEDQQQIR